MLIPDNDADVQCIQAHIDIQSQLRPRQHEQFSTHYNRIYK